MLEEFYCSNYTPVASHLDPSVKLTPDMCDPFPDPSIFRSLVIKLNFLQHTRPDISFIVQHLSQFLYHPCVPHKNIGLHVLRYLLNSPDQGIFLPSSFTFSLSAYAEFDWAAYPLLGRLVNGCFIIFCDCPISWKSKKQPTITLSFVEADYRESRKVVAKVVWMIHLFVDMGLPFISSMPIFCDS